MNRQLNSSELRTLRLKNKREEKQEERIYKHMEKVQEQEFKWGEVRQ